MRVVSLFSGIGGMDLGLERAGMEVVAQVEWDPYCQRVLSKHWPRVPKWSDIRDVEGHELPQADLYVGGFPCVDTSQVGTRRGIHDGDEGSALWRHMHRLVRTVRPRYVLVENPPGVLTRGASQILGDLASIGYDTEWDVVSACAFGAPHTRERVFFVAQPHRERRQEQWKPITSVVGPIYNQGQATRVERTGWWTVEPDVGRMASRFPGRVDRLRGLGNAVVPQVAEHVGRLIMTADKASSPATGL